MSDLTEKQEIIVVITIPIICALGVGLTVLGLSHNIILALGIAILVGFSVFCIMVSGLGEI